MTIAVGSLMGDHAVLAADSLAMQADMRLRRDTQKIWQIDGLAATGAGSRAALLLAWDVMLEAVEAADDGRLSLTEYCAALRMVLERAGMKSDDEGFLSLCLLVTDGRTLHLITSLLLPEDHDEFVAVGAGRCEAYAAHAAASRLSEDRLLPITLSVEIASQMNIGCGGPTQMALVRPGAITLVR